MPVSFRNLPVVVQFSTLATLFLGWVSFAELVIDRHGFGPLLPFYRIGNFCPYDLAVIALLIGFWFRLRRILQ